VAERLPGRSETCDGMEAMKHRSDCDCWECHNIGARKADIRRKSTPWRDLPKACDEESMTIWFEYEGDAQCKA
jgi:hypothetical protein